MQPLAKFEYHEPQSLGEAVAILGKSSTQSMIIGGGTDMVPSIRQGVFTPKHVVSLQAIPGLRNIEWDAAGGLRIGSSVTLQTLESSEEILRRLPILAAAAHEVGSPQLREMATIGGNICLDTRCYYYNQSNQWKDSCESCLKVGGEFCKATPSGRARRCFAVFSADLATALVALDASITLHSARGERTVALSDFYTGDGAAPHGKTHDEILTRISVPGTKVGSLGSYQKYRIRQSIDYPIASVALTLHLEGTREIAQNVCLVISGIGSQPVKVKRIPELIDGNPLDETLVDAAAALARKAAKPNANTAGDKSHRKQMIFELTKRAFGKIARGGSDHEAAH